MTFKHVINRFLLLALAAGLYSCEGIYDSRDNCVNGIQLKFVFDYHMEPGANAFGANVDCVNVYVFDNNGNYLTQYQETSAELAQDNYRMILPLAEGDYRLMVYGGLACSNPTFEITKPWETESSNISRDGAHHDNIFVSLPHIDGISAKPLHNIEERTGGLFYGFQYRRKGESAWTNNSLNNSKLMEVSVTNEDFGTSYTEYEVNLVKDTNNIRIILQELAGPYTVDHNDYEFTIHDDNFCLDSFNDPVPTPDGQTKPIYRPHTRQNLIMGYADNEGRAGSMLEHDDSHPVQVACVDFSTSRLHMNNFDNATLVVHSSKETEKDGSPRKIVEIPLINYLTATRGFGTGWIKTSQEYLDRQSNWTLYFFLQSGRWVTSTVAVNDWIVRIDDITLEW